MRKVERRGIVTVPSEMGERCWAVPVNDISGKHLRRSLTEASQEFVRTKRLEGEEYVDADNIHVYGPYPTPKLIEAMLSKEAMLTGSEAMSYLDKDPDEKAFSFYLLNANFMAASQSGVLLKGVA